MSQMNAIDQLLKSYQISLGAADVVRSTPIVLLVGITAAGKDTLQNKLLENTDYHKIVTHTTRQPRINNGILEQDGDNYHFISQADMYELLSNEQMIEANRFGDNYYGTSVEEFQIAQKNAKIALGDIDVNGIASFRAIATDNIIPIFIVPPDYVTWRTRLDGRYDSQEELNRELPKRLEAAERELEHALSVSYYHFVINDDLERAVRVTDEIAHGRNEFNQHDEAARQRAAQLLFAIKQHR